MSVIATAGSWLNENYSPPTKKCGLVFALFQLVFEPGRDTFLG
jgi:hypothetical protein